MVQYQSSTSSRRLLSTTKPGSTTPSAEIEPVRTRDALSGLP
jgi:hypothetical protein